MGAAWRGVRDGSEKFERVGGDCSREVSQLGMEVCVTLGEIGSVEARKLKAAGVTAYKPIISTLLPEFLSGNCEHAYISGTGSTPSPQCRKAGMSVCCGGIIGMGENRDRPVANAGGLEQFRSGSRKRADQLV